MVLLEPVMPFTVEWRRQVDNDNFYYLVYIKASLWQGSFLVFAGTGNLDSISAKDIDGSFVLSEEPHGYYR